MMNSNLALRFIDWTVFLDYNIYLINVGMAHVVGALFWYRVPHHKHEMARPPYVYNGDSYNHKTVSF